MDDPKRKGQGKTHWTLISHRITAIEFRVFMTRKFKYYYQLGIYNKLDTLLRNEICKINLHKTLQRWLLQLCRDSCYYEKLWTNMIDTITRAAT